MAPHSICVKIIAMLLILQITSSQTAKTSARPVHEIINEQSRSDDKARLNISPGNLPYGNPLAGNSQHNAKLHAQNQQAMFNAERIRQHRAQLQRWNKAPLPVDSYMKAYHESQESHQIQVELQQAKIRDNKKLANPTVRPALKTRTGIRQDTLKRGVRIIPEVIKTDGVIKEKNRNHRSHGSANFRQYLEPKMYKTVYVSPAPTYDQGVTIKPNGNVGLASLQPSAEEQSLLTAAIPSQTRHVYPKQYRQMQNYESARDIEALNALLGKAPRDQVSELNALVNSEHTESKDVLDTPIDLYFYTKAPPVQNLVSHYDHAYAQIAPTYASAYMPEVKDHTPITEEVDDIENPDKGPKVRPYGLQSILATQVPDMDTTTTKSNNYYKVEVASQTISTGYKPSEVNHHFNDIGQQYEAQAQPLVHYLKNHEDGDLSQRYLHHNAQHQGIQHLSGDGTEVSAYGDESVSKLTKVKPKSRIKRSLDKTSLLAKEKVFPLTENPLIVKNNTPKAEPLIRLHPFNKQRIETFLTTPNFPVGVAIDYNNDYENDSPKHKKRSNRGQYDVNYDDSDYNEYEDDFGSPGTEYGNQGYKQSPLFSLDSNRQNYAPSLGYNQNGDSSPSFSNKFRNIKRHPLNIGLYGPQLNNFNPYQDVSTSYGVPQYGGGNVQYGVPVGYGVPNKVIEPVYMLTQSQLQNLIGHNNLNIQHLDVFQYPSRKYRSKPKKRYPHNSRYNTKKHLHKLHKLNIF